MKRFMKNIVNWNKGLIAVLTFVISSQTAHAALLVDLSKVPMDVAEGVEPNIIFTMDDSGSMAWGWLPDGVSGQYQPWNNLNDIPPYLSADVNLMHYNPDVTYEPATDQYGSPMPNASFTNAWYNGFNTGLGSRNLETSFYPTWSSDTYLFCMAYASCGSISIANGRPYYYRFNKGCDINSLTDKQNPACYTGYTLQPSEYQNFANWFSYYRTRHLLAKTAASRAFSSLSPKIRIAYQTLNAYTSVGLMKEFDNKVGDPYRQSFFNWLYNVPASGGTPLRRAFERAGVQYERTDNDNPYEKVPGGANAGDNDEFACRQSFHIAFTDGYWNGGDPTGTINNEDNKSYTFPTQTQKDFGVTSYSPGAPYRDTNSRYLGDIAFYYWARDLRTDLENNVPQYTPYVDVGVDFNGDTNVNTDADTFWDPRNDPAGWQHMVNFTISMGLAGQLTPSNDPTDASSDFPGIIAGTTNWPNDHVDDLWHAAINSRGQYFTAQDPSKLVDQFQQILRSIEERGGSSSAPATSFPLYQAGTAIFQPLYESSDWSGDLKRLKFDTNPDPTKTDLILVEEWSAKTILNDDAGLLPPEFDPTRHAWELRGYRHWHGRTIIVEQAHWNDIRQAKKGGRRDMADALQQAAQRGARIMLWDGGTLQPATEGPP